MSDMRATPAGDPRARSRPPMPDLTRDATDPIDVIDLPPEAIDAIDAAAAALRQPRRHPAAAETLLAARSVTKRFGGLVAVRDINLDIPAGGIVSIIGPNGAGKTTFFNVIAGIIDPTAGIGGVQGQDPDHPAAPGLARIGPVDRPGARRGPGGARARGGLAGQRRAHPHHRRGPDGAGHHARRGDHPAGLVHGAPGPAGHPAQRASQRRGGGRDGPDLPEHPPVPEHDRAREHPRRHASPAQGQHGRPPDLLAPPAPGGGGRRGTRRGAAPAGRAARARERAGQEPAVRRPAPAGARPGARERPGAAPAGRADGRA